MRILNLIKESIITRWIVLYYTFFFILGSYLLLQIVLTSILLFFLRPSPDSVINIHGFYVEIDGKTQQIWDLPQFYIAIIGSAIITSVAIFIITRLLTKEPLFPYLGFRPIRKKHVIWFIYSALVLSFGIVLNELLSDKTVVEISANGMTEKVLLGLGLGIFGPFIEELLYRGFLLSRMNSILVEKYHWISILVTAFFFSAFHFQYNPIELVYIFAIGLFLSLMRLRTGSLWFPIIFHCIGNLYPVSKILFS